MKLKRALSIVIAAILTVALLAGCSPKGVYHVKTIDGKAPLEYFRGLIEEGGMKFEDYLRQTKTQEKAYEDPMILELKQDNTFVLSTGIGAHTSPVTGTWKLESGTLTLYPEGKGAEPITASVKNGTITMTDTIDRAPVEIVYVRR